MLGCARELPDKVVLDRRGLSVILDRSVSVSGLVKGKVLYG